MFPMLPPHVPQRGTSLSRSFWRKAFLSHGWQIKGEIPNIPKALLIGAPHTSNMDGWYAFMGIMGLGLDITIMAKDSLFKPPFQALLKWLNVMPVNRSSATGLVEQVKARFEQQSAVWIGIAPEGTRAGAKQWKSGFYHMALSAQVPIVMIGLDYAKKQIIFLGTFYPSGNYNSDLQKILAHYQGLTPYHQNKLSHPLRSKSSSK
ncbi:lysophospholipid acyltransferase family protein [Alkanindiges sp. WGS2144]|uniref:lysophospholipid acyltransferase family protein n=1 Tax=Alkanindiges sp. WGS2144 TaxID=3366808 RepID=UPI003753660A